MLNDHDGQEARRTALWQVGVRGGMRPAVALAAALLVLVGLLTTAPTAAAGSASPSRGEKPVAVRIPAIGVAAAIEVRTTVDNQMQDPTGPEVVA